MQYLFGLITALVIWAVIAVIFNQSRKKITVHETTKGLLFVKGKYVKTLDPGEHVINPRTSEVVCEDMRRRFAMVGGQEVLSIDGISIKISLIAIYSVSDAYLAHTTSQDPQTAIYALLQLALREIVSTMEIDDVLAKRHEIGTLVAQRISESTTEYGLALHEVSVKDIMFPGALRNTFAQIVTARKDAQASLERARGEAAAMRSLANTARMLESNPRLMQLRTLQFLTESSGNTVVLNMNPDLDSTSMTVGSATADLDSN